MAFEDLLVHKATIYRRQEGEDAFHNPKNSFAAVVGMIDVPCRVTISSLGGGFANLGGERNEESQTHVMEDRRIYMPKGYEVVEDDQVSVYDKNGRMIVPISNITFVRHIYDKIGDEHHIELLIKVWRKANFAS